MASGPMSADHLAYRFVQFPITIYVDGHNADPDWLEAINHAVYDLHQYMPVELAANADEATIYIGLVDEITWCGGLPSPFEDFLGCGGVDVIECQFDDICDIISGSGEVEFTTPCKRTVLTHEILHAMGIDHHPTDQQALMYEHLDEEACPWLTIPDWELVFALYPEFSF